MGKVWKESPAALLSYLLPSSAHLLLLGKDYGRKVEITTLLLPPPPPPLDQMHEKEFQETFEIPPPSPCGRGEKPRAPVFERS